jgi:cytochrome c-type biogenesis protein CcmH
MFTPIPPTSFARVHRKGAIYCAPTNSLFVGLRGGVILLALLLLSALPISAQSDTPSSPVTFDDVNAIASKMYCPECENIPLDKCGSPVCIQWKGEIADQLAAGRTEQEIVDGFVARFGDQVLGIPQDPTLRNISLISPYIFAGMILVIGVWTFLRWRGRSQSAVEVPSAKAPDDDRYRSRLENDLRL